MNKIKKQSKLLYKKLKGKLEVLNVVEFLGTLGYDVIFFNDADKTDFALRYGIELGDTKAITYFGDTRIVFVKDELSRTDKLHVLFHECGHILLGHVEENQIHSIDSIQSENEAEVFAYELTHYAKNKWKKPSLFLSVLLLISLHGIIYTNAATANDIIVTANEVTDKDYITTGSDFLVDATKNVTTPPQEETVYITRTGKCYHTSTCRYITENNSSKLLKTEAEKTHSPCGVCNP